MSNRHRVDRAERGVRFGCGVIVGAVLGFLVTVFAMPDAVEGAVAAAVLAALAFGVLAAHYGNRFWERLIDVAQWFWWW